MGNNVYVGEIINLTGDGWGSEEAITVAVTKFKGAVLGQPLVVQTATTQVNGALSVGFPVPSLGDVGTLTIEVTGETSNSQTHVRRDGVTLLSWELQGSSDYPVIHMTPMEGVVGTNVNLTVNRNFAGGP